MTADELLTVPDDSMRHELVAGEHRVMNPPGSDHGRVAFRLATLLGRHVEETGCGVGFAAETGFILGRDPDTVRAPDAAFVSRERYEALGATPKFWPEAPAFVAEVLSPSDSFTEVEEKALAWLDAGVKAVLVLDPQRRTATVYRARDNVVVHAGSEELDLSDAVPGWRVKASDLFG